MKEDLQELTEKEISRLRKLGRYREFANLSKKMTGLPVNIWVDDSQSYIQGRHAKRIKFQINSEHTWVSTNKRETACMDLEGNVIEKTFNAKHAEITSKEIKAVSNFVKNNAEALELLSDEIIDISDFTQVMIKGGELCSPEVKQAKLKNLEELVDWAEAEIIRKELNYAKGIKR